MGAAVLLVMILYVVLAVGLVLLVRWITPKKLYRWLAVAFVILLPTWDAVLGYIVYYPACLFIPKVAIFETAETDVIYYEGEFNNYARDLRSETGKVRTVLLNASKDFEKGYKYVESLVTEYAEQEQSYSQRRPIPPTIYRCNPVSTNSSNREHISINCVPVNTAQSGYAVKSSKVKIGRAEIRKVQIINRSTGALMADYREVMKLPYAGFPGVPFFTWADWSWGGGVGVSCPAESRYANFQYDVLKVKR